MADIKWLPDGQKMFDKLMAAVPEGMRDAIKPKLLEMLSGKAAGQPVNGDLVPTQLRSVPGRDRLVSGPVANTILLSALKGSALGGTSFNR